MDPSGAARNEHTSVLPASSVPLLVLAAGVLVLAVGVSQAVLALFSDGPLAVALFDLLFVGVPGSILLYTGRWMPRSDIVPRYYPRLIAWVVGAIVVMFGFILLRDLHPGVTAEWSVGTQAIALMIGSVGGLAIGIQETRATVRTAQLEERTRELEARERQLTRQNERLEEFANVVSHDLRNPLNVADGRLELAREECDSEHLDRVAQAHDRMEVLIDDLLTLAREGAVVTDPEPVDLDAVLEACWANVATSEATLRADLDRTVRADESRLKQLFENLVRNAVEHGGTGVTVTVGELPNGFYVEDTGPGIPADEREDVFDTGYSTSQDGTGFGLSIVEQVAKAHGWDVRATDGADGGARFEIFGVECVDE